MSFIEQILTAFGLSMDAFAVAICTGLSLKKFTLKAALTVGLYFGIFQAGMPVIGYFAGTFFADKINAVDHWIAFGVLGFLGARMILGSFGKEDIPENSKEETSLGVKIMLPLAIATSIDALAVGVSFAFLSVEIAPAVMLIGGITLVMSMIGVKIGNVFGARFKSKAEFAGGAILVGIGVKILLEAIL
jgi:putative Mn2+ efflux pump MntP